MAETPIRWLVVARLAPGAPRTGSISLRGVPPANSSGPRVNLRSVRSHLDSWPGAPSPPASGRQRCPCRVAASRWPCLIREIRLNAAHRRTAIGAEIRRLDACIAHWIGIQQRGQVLFHARRTMPDRFFPKRSGRPSRHCVSHVARLRGFRHAFALFQHGPCPRLCIGADELARADLARIAPATVVPHRLA